MKDAKLEVGVDTLRDPFTGVVYEIERIWRPEDIAASPYMRGSGSERSALYGGPSPKEFQRRDIPRVCPARDGRLKESA